METVQVNALKLDQKNANAHTVRGLGLLSQSLDKFGAGRPIVLDRRNQVIAGNAVAEFASESGITEVIVVDTEPDELLVVERTDLDIHDSLAREMAFADNRVAELNLEWRKEVVDALAEEIDISAFWNREAAEEVEREVAARQIEQKVIENEVVIYALAIGTHRGEITHDEMQRFKEVFTHYVNETGTSYGFISWLLNLEDGNAENDNA